MKYLVPGLLAVLCVVAIIGVTNGIGAGVSQPASGISSSSPPQVHVGQPCQVYLKQGIVRPDKRFDEPPSFIGGSTPRITGNLVSMDVNWVVVTDGGADRWIPTDVIAAVSVTKPRNPAVAEGHAHDHGEGHDHVREGSEHAH